MASEPTNTLVNERAQHLLKLLVERYIRDGQPVGSKTLAQDPSLSVSSATIRNIMSELEDKGYVSSIHTSSGRVPTTQGYRFFVDSLLTVKPLEAADIKRFKEQLISPDYTNKDMVASASNLLSSITHMAGVVTLPKRNEVALRHVEFLPLSGCRVLAILVVNEDDVQNKIVQTQRQYTESELRQASNYINENFIGQEMRKVSAGIVEAMRKDQTLLQDSMRSVVDIASAAFKDHQAHDEYIVAGQEHIFDFIHSSTDMSRIRHLLEAFTQKKDILHLLERCIGTDGVQIYIGKESGYEWFDECSVVSAPYERDGEILGVLGVIGPTRMRYDKIVPLVDVTAKLMSLALDRSKGNS